MKTNIENNDPENVKLMDLVRHSYLNRIPDMKLINGANDIYTIDFNCVDLKDFDMLTVTFHMMTMFMELDIWQTCHSVATMEGATTEEHFAIKAAKQANQRTMTIIHDEFAAAADRRNRLIFLPDPAQHLNDLFVEVQKILQEWYRENLATPKAYVPKKRGGNLVARQPEEIKLPTASTATDFITVVNNGEFKLAEGRHSAWAQRNSTQVSVAIDETILAAEKTIELLAKKGPAITQTFLAMVGLWMEKKQGCKYNDTLHATATDILKFMDRKGTGRGGFKNDEVSRCAENIYLLMQMSVPIAKETKYLPRNRVEQDLEISKVLDIESIRIKRQYEMNFENQENEKSFTACVIECKYHLSEKIHEWLCGDHPQYANISSKILQYHPTRQKYHILLGICLATYARINMKKNGGEKISLTSLLRMASIDIPTKDTSRFLGFIRTAISELSTDSVLPGVTLSIPYEGKNPLALASKSAREQIESAVVYMPKRLLESDELATKTVGSTRKNRRFNAQKP